MRKLEICSQDLLEFVKMLIECGGVYEVQNDYTIINKDTGEHITIKRGAEEKLLVIFHENMPVGNYAIWVPFKESIGIHKEKEWFFGVITTTPGVLLKMLMMKLVSEVANKSDKTYAQFDLMSKLVDKCDKTMVDELDKIGSNDYLSIHYNKSKKTAVAETMLFSEEIKEKYPKFRKKTWDVIHTIFAEIFGADETEDHRLVDSYKWMSKILDIPETEAKIKVYFALIEALAPFIKSYLNIEIDTNTLSKHIELLEGYSKIYAYASTAQTAEQQKPKQQQPAPWATQQPWQQQQQMMNPYQQAMPISPVPQMPVYGQPQVNAPIADMNNAIPISKYNGRAFESVANDALNAMLPPQPVYAFGVQPPPQQQMFAPQMLTMQSFNPMYQNTSPNTTNILNAKMPF